MGTLVGLVRVLALLVLAVVAMSLVIGVARPETGVLEKVGMLLLLVGCVAAAAKISSMAATWRGRLRHH